MRRAGNEPVENWSPASTAIPRSRSAWLAATLLAATTIPNVTNAQSVTSDCAASWGRYQAAPGPKAFANGSKQGCGWQIKNDSYPTAAAIRAQAIRQCVGYAGASAGCRIISESK